MGVLKLAIRIFSPAIISEGEKGGEDGEIEGEDGEIEGEDLNLIGSFLGVLRFLDVI